MSKHKVFHTNPARTGKMPNYEKIILEEIARGGIPPGVTFINVYHENWCDALKGGTCNCDPDVIQTKDPPKKPGNDDQG